MRLLASDARPGRSGTGCRQPRYEETHPAGGHVPISGPPVPPGPVTTPPGSSTTGAISHAGPGDQEPPHGDARKVTGEYRRGGPAPAAVVPLPSAAVGVRAAGDRR